MKHYSIYAIIFLSIIGLLVIFIGTTREASNKDGLFSKKDEGLSIRLIKEDGFITWKKEGDAEYVRVEVDEISIPNNSYVKTGDGRGYVILPDESSVSLSRNTEILVSYTPKSVSIIQLLGTTYHRVMSLSEGSSYQVQTTGTLAAVRGTKFAVMYDEKIKKTNIVVTENTVDVSTRNETTSESNQKVRNVAEGEMVTVKEEEMGASSLPIELTLKASTTRDTGTQPKVREFRMYVDSQKEKAVMKSWIDENKKIDEIFEMKRNKSSFIKDMVNEMNVEMEKEEKSTTAARTSDAGEYKETIRMRSIDRALITLKNRKEIDTEIESMPKSEEKEIQSTTTTTQPKAIEREPLLVKPLIRTVPTDQVVQAPVLKEYDPNKEVLSDSEQLFIDSFYSTYESYLYADNNALVCRRIEGVSAKDIVLRLEEITSKAGYLLPRKEEIFSLAQTIVASCEDGTLLKNVDALQTKFDVIYPY